MKYLAKLTFLFSIIIFNTFASENKIANVIELTEEEIVTLSSLKTGEKIVLWIGCGCPSEFDSEYYFGAEKKRFIEEGLSILKKQQTSQHLAMLTMYYLEKEDMPKALYWALLGAEKGCAYCMSVLRGSYAQGLGVVKDEYEMTKWAYLAAAKGGEEEKKVIEEFSKFDDIRVKNILSEGKRRAQEWMNSHPKAFFEPN